MLRLTAVCCTLERNMQQVGAQRCGPCSGFGACWLNATREPHSNTHACVAFHSITRLTRFAQRPLSSRLRTITLAFEVILYAAREECQRCTSTHRSLFESPRIWTSPSRPLKGLGQRTPPSSKLPGLNAGSGTPRTPHLRAPGVHAWLQRLLHAARFGREAVLLLSVLQMLGCPPPQTLGPPRLKLHGPPSPVAVAAAAWARCSRTDRCSFHRPDSRCQRLVVLQLSPRHQTGGSEQKENPQAFIPTWTTHTRPTSFPALRRTSLWEHRWPL